MPKLGDISRTPGKVVDSSVYKVKDVIREAESEGEDPSENGHDEEGTKVVNKSVTVEVRLVKSVKHSEEAPHPLNAISFVVSCKELDIEIEGTDIEALRAAMWAKLDKQFGIRWELYYLVDVSSRLPYTGSGSGFVVSYDTVYKGTTWDGKLLLRQLGCRGQKVEAWPGEFRREGDRVLACIPGTSVNEAALKEFIRRTDLLREKIQEFLRPEQIMHTLANMRGFDLLPEESQKEKV